MKKLFIICCVISAMQIQSGFAMLRVPKIKTTSLFSNLNRTIASSTSMNVHQLSKTQNVRLSTTAHDWNPEKGRQQVNKFHRALLKDFKNKSTSKDHGAPACFKSCDCASYKMVSTHPSLLEVQNEDGDNALAVAVKHNRIWAVETLLKKRHIKTNVKDKNGNLPLKVALTQYLTLLDREAANLCHDLDNGIMIRTKHPLYVQSSIAGRIATMLATRMSIRGEKLVTHQEIATALGKKEVLDQALIEKEVDFIYASAKKRRDDLAAKWDQTAAELDKYVKAAGDDYSQFVRGREVSVEELEMGVAKVREAAKVLSGECDDNCTK